jgi:hypothetical protein
LKLKVFAELATGIAEEEKKRNADAFNCRKCRKAKQQFFLKYESRSTYTRIPLLVSQGGT